MKVNSKFPFSVSIALGVVLTVVSATRVPPGEAQPVTPEIAPFDAKVHLTMDRTSYHLDLKIQFSHLIDYKTYSSYITNAAISRAISDHVANLSRIDEETIPNGNRFTLKATGQSAFAGVNFKKTTYTNCEETFTPGAWSMDCSADVRRGETADLIISLRTLVTCNDIDLTYSRCQIEVQMSPQRINLWVVKRSPRQMSLTSAGETTLKYVALAHLLENPKLEISELVTTVKATSVGEFYRQVNKDAAADGRAGFFGEVYELIATSLNEPVVRTIRK